MSEKDQYRRSILSGGFQCLTFIAAIVFGVWAVKSYDAALTSNQLAAASIEQSLVANKLALIALCKADAALSRTRACVDAQEVFAIGYIASQVGLVPGPSSISAAGTSTSTSTSTSTGTSTDFTTPPTTTPTTTPTQTPTPSSSPPPPSGSSPRRLNAIEIVFIVGGVTSAVLTLVMIFVFMRKKRSKG
ncbi:hypothetical protein FRC17_002084 [Serendipita sp. 399]|nr:hypothetical protein FRC17_002084 [Serendipita sp. 399]